MKRLGPYCQGEYVNNLCVYWVSCRRANQDTRPYCVACIKRAETKVLSFSL